MESRERDREKHEGEVVSDLSLLSPLELEGAMLPALVAMVEARTRQILEAATR